MLKRRPHRRTGRPRGAPLGNTNALKHGLYAQYISVSEEADLENMPPDKNAEELAIARVCLKRCLEKQAAAASPEQWLDYDKQIAHYLRIIMALIHKNALLGMDKRAAYVTVMEMIAEVNKEQGVS